MPLRLIGGVFGELAGTPSPSSTPPSRTRGRREGGPTPLLLSIGAAARLLGCRKAHVAALVNRGALATVKVGPGRAKIPRAEVERLALEGAPRPGPKPRGRRQGSATPEDVMKIDLDDL